MAKGEVNEEMRADNMDRQVLLKLIPLLDNLGADRDVQQLLPDYIEGKHTAQETLRRIDEVIGKRNNEKEEILFQVSLLKRKHCVTNEEIVRYKPVFERLNEACEKPGRHPGDRHA